MKLLEFEEDQYINSYHPKHKLPSALFELWIATSCNGFDVISGFTEIYKADTLKDAIKWASEYFHDKMKSIIEAYEKLK